MISKELKRLSRRELVDIIYQMKKNEQQLEEELASLREEVQDKRLRLSNAGSIAEAAVSVANVLSSAQNAADIYLQEIARMKEDAQAECAALIEEAQRKAAEIVSEGQTRCAAMEEQYRRECEKWHRLHQEVLLMERAGFSDKSEE